ncbi:MAG: hypothetical protein NXI30_18615 [bacterium]|nr:hypothetical protein [bacterium]
MKLDSPTLRLATCLGLLLGGVAVADDEATTEAPLRFGARFDVGIVPSEKSAHVEIHISDPDDAVEWLRFQFDESRYRAIDAQGSLEASEEGLVWTPPKGGGRLRYVHAIDHLRSEGEYDARCAKNWALLRGQDLVPRVRIRTKPNAESDSTMRLRLPEGWSIAVPYRRISRGRYDLANDRTRFDRPTGWFAFGRLGVVRERVGDMRLAIVGPAGQGVRRMDVLALTRWVAPELSKLFGRLPDRFQVVIAGDPMWRGALSAPRSAYVHVDRPLIQGDGSSPLLHEMIHSLMHARSGDDGRWIAEGIAEYYSIALLRRSDTLSPDRFESAIEKLTDRAASPSKPLDGEMNGALRARAVVVLLELDEMIREATAGAGSLDDVVRELVARDQRITTAGLQEASEATAGRAFDAFFDALPFEGG